MNRRDVFASMQIINFNPILKKNSDIRTQYFMYLVSLIRLVRWDKRKYTKAQIALYKNILCGQNKKMCGKRNMTLDPCYSYLLPFDITAMMGFQKKVMQTDKIAAVTERIVFDFNLPDDTTEIFLAEFSAALGDEKAWDDVVLNIWMRPYKEYLQLVKDNILFIEQRPYNILLTATMSAGKSTLINALAGKNISLTQNMACTSKIHAIVSKMREDGFISEYDHEVSLDASAEELLHDSDNNNSFKITVGTYFNGSLGGLRFCFFDSPGVNSSENMEHREISRKIIHSRRYKLLIYVLNSTQLGTTDEEQHLELVAKQIGRKKLIFVMNKIDHLISEDDKIFDVIDRQRKFLISKGIKNPIICPVSARAAYLVKKSWQETLGRIERREIENYEDKFERISLRNYYEKRLNCPAIASVKDEKQNLFRNCGFAYLERIIEHLYKGGKINGTGIC